MVSSERPGCISVARSNFLFTLKSRSDRRMCALTTTLGLKQIACNSESTYQVCTHCLNGNVGHASEAEPCVKSSVPDQPTATSGFSTALTCVIISEGAKLTKGQIGTHCGANM